LQVVPEFKDDGEYEYAENEDRKVTGRASGPETANEVGRPISGIVLRNYLLTFAVYNIALYIKYFTTL